MRCTSWAVALFAGAAFAGLGGAGCSTTGSQPSEHTASNGYYRGPIGNGAFGEAVPAADREDLDSRSGPARDCRSGADHGYTGNGAFGE